MYLTIIIVKNNFKKKIEYKITKIQKMKKKIQINKNYFAKNKIRRQYDS